MTMPRIATAEELRVAEIAVALIEIRIREHLYACPYRDDGPEAYREAENAIRAVFVEVRGSFERIRRDIARAEKRERGL